jgi:hypothetical protein
VTTWNSVNFAVAVEMTTQARLKLYEYLRTLGESVLYCDTNSVICIHKVDETQNVKTSDYLGDLTEELKESGAGSYIEEFLSDGPKSYAFSVFPSRPGSK